MLNRTIIFFFGFSLELPAAYYAACNPQQALDSTCWYGLISSRARMVFSSALGWCLLLLLPNTTHRCHLGGTYKGGLLLS